MSVSAFNAALTVVMFVGAANADATPGQREKLREAIEPLRDKSLTASEAYGKVIRRTADIMGPGWSPQGEWDTWITRLLKEEK